MFENFPYTDMHQLNLDWIISLVNEIKNTYPEKFEELMNIKVNKPAANPNGNLGDYLISNGDGTTSWKPLDIELQEEIIDAVDDWLEDHPEATTTVLDGAVTYPKLADSLKGVVYNPDVESGSDAVKLQLTINKAIQDDYATILLTRLYDITGSSLLLNKYLYNIDTKNRQKLTFLGIGTGGIIKKDNGYIFTGTISHSPYQFSAGDIQFINVNFRGADTNYDIDKNNYCSVFDCHKLIRITTFGCSFWNVGTVFDGTECADGTCNMQSNRNYSDIVTYSHAYYKMNYTWDIVVNGCIIENCDYGFVFAGGGVTDLRIKDCCIENSRYEAIRAVDTSENDRIAGINQVIIDGCYFELNCNSEMLVARDIYFHARFTYGLTITNCRFAPDNTRTYRCMDILIRNDDFVIDGNTTSVDSAYDTLVYLDFSDASATIYKFYYNFNYVTGSTVLTNVPTVFMPIARTATGLFEGLVASGFSNDLNDILIAAKRNVVIHVLSTDNALNAPPNETDGLFESVTASDGNCIQKWYNTTKKTSWLRTRTTGIGWSAWLPASGSYSFVKSNLKHGDSVTLPISGFKGVVTACVVYSSMANAAILTSANMLTANDTSFTFHALDPSTKQASALAGLTVCFTVTPDLS